MHVDLWIGFLYCRPWCTAYCATSVLTGAEERATQTLNLTSLAYLTYLNYLNYLCSHFCHWYTTTLHQTHLAASQHCKRGQPSTANDARFVTVLDAHDDGLGDSYWPQSALDGH